MRGHNRNMNAPMRVLLLEVPTLLRDILEHAIRHEGDCVLIHTEGSPMEILADRADSPDVVILGLAVTEDVALVPALLGRWPSAHVLTVMQTGSDAAVYELTPRCQALGEMSPEGMLVLLRDSVQRRREFAKKSFIS
jgi:hypothetical protein